jgi:hypothetical protein
MKCLKCLMLCIAGSWVATAMADLVPARLPVAEGSIEELLRIPEDLLPGQYAVNCETHVRTTGQSENFNCYASSAVPEPLRKAVIDAGNKARFVPAIRDGREIDVRMLLSTLVYIGNGSRPLVLATPNIGTDRNRYGLLYSAPQSILDSRRRRGPLSALDLQTPFNEVHLWMALEIDAAGQVTGREILSAPRESALRIRELDSRIEGMKFIPASDGDKSVPSIYIEAIYERG